MSEFKYDLYCYDMFDGYYYYYTTVSVFACDVIDAGCKMETFVDFNFGLKYFPHINPN